jgi:hypothetical protein
MHAPAAAHAFLPLGQMHMPPGAEHDEPVIDAQSAFVQHAAESMHALLAVHVFCPVGHLHMSPGALHF